MVNVGRAANGSPVLSSFVGHAGNVPHVRTKRRRPKHQPCKPRRKAAAHDRAFRPTHCILQSAGTQFSPRPQPAARPAHPAARLPRGPFAGVLTSVTEPALPATTGVPTMNRPARTPLRYLKVNGREVQDFVIDYEDFHSLEEIRTVHGPGKRLRLWGTAKSPNGAPLKKIVAVEMYRRYPGAALFQTEYANLGSSALHVDTCDELPPRPQLRARLLRALPIVSRTVKKLSRTVTICRWTSIDGSRGARPTGNRRVAVLRPAHPDAARHRLIARLKARPTVRRVDARQPCSAIRATSRRSWVPPLLPGNWTGPAKSCSRPICVDPAAADTRHSRWPARR